MLQQDQSGSHARPLDEGREVCASRRDFLFKCLTGYHRGRSGCANARHWDHPVKDLFGQGDQAQRRLHHGGHVTVCRGALTAVRTAFTASAWSLVAGRWSLVEPACTPLLPTWRAADRLPASTFEPCIDWGVLVGVQRQRHTHALLGDLD